MSRARAAFGFVIAALAAQPAAAATTARVVVIANGVHSLNLDGQPIMTVRARRENYNAHGFDVLSFYAVKRGRPSDALQLVPIFGAEQGQDKERYELTIGGGADCLLNDFRLVPGSGRQAARLVVAEREFGASYAAPGIVHFTYYELTRNRDELPGRPPLYFQARMRTDSRQAYCDVNEAFDRELHLGKSSDGSL